MPWRLSCHNLHRTAQPESIFASVEHLIPFGKPSLMEFSYTDAKKSSDNWVVEIPLWLCNHLLAFGASTSGNAPFLSTLNLQSFAMTLWASVVHFCHLLVESSNAHPNFTIFVTKEIFHTAFIHLSYSFDIFFVSLLTLCIILYIMETKNL